MGPERSPRTVADVWVNAAKTVFTWAVDERLIANNPFTQVKITVPRGKKLGGNRGVTLSAEAREIGRAVRTDALMRARWISGR